MIFYYDPIFLEHDTGAHPERPERLSVILTHLKGVYGDDFRLHAPRRAAMEELTPVHDRAYLESVRAKCDGGGGALDGDTPVSPRSFEAALHAAGALLDGADVLAEGRDRFALALVRPPGHHARPAAGMGFCLINNIAVAARYLMQRHGLDRVLIADFDVHHGNGTQEIFYRDPDVFFLSMHRYPFYPGTGGTNETGEGPGEGKTLNLPVPLGTPPDEIVDAFTHALRSAARDHRPGMLLVSAGFDAFAEDPVGGLGLLPGHFADLGRAVRETAEEVCDGKVLTALEGGYSLTGLPLCLAAYLAALSPQGE
jgi:acetoin utilization deacetylase AcuC-like enzyme